MSLSDLVKKANEDKEEKKSSSLRELVKKVNSGNADVATKLNDSEVSDWGSAVNDVVILTADVYKEDGSTLRFSAGTVVTYTGSSWIEYTGEITTAA